MQSVYLIIFSKVFLKICYVRWKSSNTAVITARFFFPAEQQLCSMSVSDDWHLGVYYRLSFRETKPVAVAGL